MTLTTEAVLALAPDAASAKAARSLVAPAQWPTLGANEKAVWGECQGSGAKPYQTQVDLAGPTFRCSCPSRKFPCKHGLALLLLRVQDANRFTTTDAPAWVSEWLNAREEKAQKKEEKERTQAEKPVDPEAVLKNERARWKRIETATVDLQRWLIDQVNHGLGALGAAQRKDWEVIAARLVDAQAPGLASRVRDAAACLGNRALPPETLLKHLGMLQLACDAISRREVLPSDMQADLRVLVGWPLDKAEVIAKTLPVNDRWIVLGQVSEEREGKLTERRVWLHGERTNRRALLLDHAFGGKGFERAWINGTAVETALVFFPGAANLRALAVSTEYQTEPASLPLTTPAQEWRALAARAAACPWVPLHPMLWCNATPHRGEDRNWLECEGERVPLAIGETDIWALLAMSGGHAVQVVGEWDGATLRPLAARSNDGAWQQVVQ